MKSTLKLIRRFLLVLIFSLVLLLLLNLILFFALTFHQASNGSPWDTADQISANLIQTPDGSYQLSEEGNSLLDSSGAWAILLDNHSGAVKWNSENLPDEIPRQYSLSDLSWALRGYIKDYPTTSSGYGEDLLVLGHPKTSYWKAMWNTFDYQVIAHLPQTVLLFFFFNLAIILIIYMVTVSRVLRSVRPIVAGIEALPDGREVYVKEKGLLSSLASSLNRASEKLQLQEYSLKKKETARANWIAGVSHDIRTPLSVSMGYASQLEEDISLPEKARKKAGMIRRQSQRMKNLINDLNLASKLEYNVQPLHMEKINAVAFLRQIVVDFLNLDLDGKYPIQWEGMDTPSPCVIWGDPALLRRAISNLIINAQLHNPKGCAISAGVSQEDEEGFCRFVISDNGKGVTEEQLNSIRNKPHYMVCDSNTGEQRHGLGLLIVRQIASAHGGRMEVGHSPQGGFCVSLLLPQEAGGKE